MMSKFKNNNTIDAINNIERKGSWSGLCLISPPAFFKHHSASKLDYPILAFVRPKTPIFRRPVIAPCDEIRRSQLCIRVNPFLFNKNPNDNSSSDCNHKLRQKPCSLSMDAQDNQLSLTVAFRRLGSYDQ